FEPDEEVLALAVVAGDALALEPVDERLLGLVAANHPQRGDLDLLDALPDDLLVQVALERLDLGELRHAHPCSLGPQPRIPVRRRRRAAPRRPGPRPARPASWTDLRPRRGAHRRGG